MLLGNVDIKTGQTFIKKTSNRKTMKLAEYKKLNEEGPIHLENVKALLIAVRKRDYCILDKGVIIRLFQGKANGNHATIWVAISVNIFVDRKVKCEFGIKMIQQFNICHYRKLLSPSTLKPRRLD